MPPAEYRKRITTPKELAKCMARLAERLRDSIGQAFAAGTPTDLMMELRDACAARMPELTQSADAGGFADLFAQIVVYGLFSSRCTDSAWQFQRGDGGRALCTTDPFLRRLVEALAAKELDREPFTGLIANLGQLLADTDFDVVLESLGRHGAGLDPVVHFYESFLAAYDPQLRKDRGVYYTPEPIVSFIIRAVDDLLKTRFGVPAGLAEQDVPPRVLLIDPACGTGSFLSAALGLIRDRVMKQKKWQTWSNYVRGSLLCRLHGFELLPAPWAVAHLHLGRKLSGHDLPAGPQRKQCAHEFAGDEQLGIHRTNSLEGVAEGMDHVLGNFGALNKERTQTSAPDRAILVVLGNPPYRGISANPGKWLTRLLEEYRLVNGAPLGEKKVWLRNDYVQFIRLGQWGIERTGQGVLAVITDNSYLDSATFRGMRQNLVKTFDEIYVLNLHGNAKRRERAPNGSRDENVFDIRQGVAIVLFVKQSKNRTAGRVLYGELWGSRQSKWSWLTGHRLGTISWTTVTPASPGFELVAVNQALRAEYERGWPLKQIFPVSSSGIQTSRDSLVVAFDERALVRRLHSFLAADKTDQEVRSECFGDKSVGNYPPGDTREWQLAEARGLLRQHRAWRRAIASYLYRPFDQRSLLYLDCMVDWPRREVMRHLQQPNYALCVGRAGLVASGTWDLVFCVNQMCDHNLFYRGSSLNYPLYLYPGGKLPQGLVAAGRGLCPNLSKQFLHKVTETLRLRFVADKPGDLWRTIGPADILHYAYAILHSSTYRGRYSEFLKFDFPRLPLTANRELFRALCIRGAKLVRAHLMDKEAPDAISFPVRGDNVVRQVRYLAPSPATGAGRVGINDTQYFDDVPPEVWRFCVGGYQVCQKWLKDRKGRRLSPAEQGRFSRIVGVLSESLSLVSEIDALIEEHGGWPFRLIER